MVLIPLTGVELVVQARLHKEILVAQVQVVDKKVINLCIKSYFVMR